MTYPIAIIFKLGFLKEIIFTLGLAWLINIFFAKDKNNKFLSFLIALFFLLSYFLENKIFSYFYPIMINVFFLFIFATSLKKQAIITKFALLKEKKLSDFALKYTRNLTKIWSVFFLVNGLICLFLIFLEDKTYWAYFTGFISYILIGILFIGEFMIRNILKRRFDD